VSLDEEVEGTRRAALAAGVQPEVLDYVAALVRAQGASAVLVQPEPSRSDPSTVLGGSCPSDEPFFLKVCTNPYQASGLSESKDDLGPEGKARERVGSIQWPWASVDAPLVYPPKEWCPHEQAQFRRQMAKSLNRVMNGVLRCAKAIEATSGVKVFSYPTCLSVPSDETSWRY